MMLSEVSKNGSIVISALSTLVLATGTNIVYSNTYNAIPVVCDVKCVGNNSTPCYYTINKKVAYEEAYELFGEVRGFTKEESQKYKDSLSKLFKPTGDNFFDL